MSFGTFLKNLDQLLFSQYTFEKYSEGKPLTANQTFQFEQPQFKSKDETLLDNILLRLDKLPLEHEGVKFCLDRKIPQIKFNQIYFIENIKNIVQLNEDYRQSISGEEPRLVLPFYDEDLQLSGVTCRAIRGEALRYLTVKIKENKVGLFGLNTVDKTKLIYVCEGPIDSLFLPNGVAVGSTSLERVDQLGFTLEQTVLVYDNQPRNKQLCSLMNRSIDQGRHVVVWPQTIPEKDLNDMVLSGRSIATTIKQNTFSGLVAKAKFVAWRRV